KSVVDKWPEIQETMKPKVEQLKTFISDNTPIQKSDMKMFEENNSSSDSSSNSSSQSSTIPEHAGDMATSAFAGTFSFLGTYLLTFIYIFFLLNYRRRFKYFLFSLFPDEKKQEVDQAIYESANIVQQYLVGKLLLIGIVAVLYAIGLGVSG